MGGLIVVVQQPVVFLFTFESSGQQVNNPDTDTGIRLRGPTVQDDKNTTCQRELINELQVGK